MCPPATATYTLRIMTSLFCSASTTASCTHFIAVSKSTISPLRTPREGAWPTPRSLIVPSVRPSPTTTQIFDVPISRPTIKSLLTMLVSPFSFVRPEWFAHWHRLRIHVRFRGRGRTPCCPLHRYRPQSARLRIGLDRVIDDAGRRLGERHWNVSLDEQVRSRKFALRIIGINQKLR